MAELRGDWAAQIAAARAISPVAIELSALSENELPALRRFLAHGPRLPFRYLSVHGPAKDREVAEDELVSILLDIGLLVEGVVMHPDTFEHIERYRRLGRKLVIENMDARKAIGRTAAELAPILAELPEAGFCFDIAHAWSIDRDMAAAHEMLGYFGNRLRHVHLSSLSPELHHIPLTEDDELLFAPVLDRCEHVPWILEAPPRMR